MSLLDKRILITGATGFVGANLTRALLANGFKNIAIISRENSDFWRINDIRNKLKNFKADLLEFGKIKKIFSVFMPHVVFHLACYGGYAYQNDSKEIINTNILGSFNLLRAALETGLELFINVGTSSEYGLKNRLMKESDLLEPFSLYAASKASSGLLAHAFFKTYKLPIVNVRLFSPYGYFEDRQRFIPSFIIAALRGNKLKLTAGRQKRDFIFIEDITRAFIKLIKHKRQVIGKTFNIACGKEFSLRQVGGIILKRLGNPIKPDWGALEYRKNEQFRWQADISKAKEMLNLQPKINLENGLMKTIDWFKENLGKFQYYA